MPNAVAISAFTDGHHASSKPSRSADRLAHVRADVVACLAQQAADVLGGGHGERVEDVPGQVGRVGEQRAELVFASGIRTRRGGGRRGERPGMVRIAAQLVGDVRDDAVVRGRRGRQHQDAGRHLWDQVAHGGRPVGKCGPVADAMRLVDDQHPEPRRSVGAGLPKQRMARPFRRDSRTSTSSAADDSSSDAHSCALVETIAAPHAGRSATTTSSRMSASSGETKTSNTPRARGSSSRRSTRRLARPFPLHNGARRSRRQASRWLRTAVMDCAEGFPTRRAAPPGRRRASSRSRAQPAAATASGAGRPAAYWAMNSPPDALRTLSSAAPLPDRHDRPRRLPELSQTWVGTDAGASS